MFFYFAIEFNINFLCVSFLEIIAPRSNSQFSLCFSIEFNASLWVERKKRIRKGNESVLLLLYLEFNENINRKGRALLKLSVIIFLKYEREERNWMRMHEWKGRRGSLERRKRERAWFSFSPWKEKTEFYLTRGVDYDEGGTKRFELSPVDRTNRWWFQRS